MKHRTKTLASTKKAPGGSLAEHKERAKRFGFLKRRLANVDVEKVWEQLERDLVIGEGRRRPGKILESMDNAERNTDRAAMILRVALEELAEVELDFRAKRSTWEIPARASIDKDKKEKKASGQTTVSQVEDRMSRDNKEYREWVRAISLLKRTRDSAESMKDNWESRRSTLRHMSKAIEIRGVDSGMLDRPRRNKSGEDE